MDVSVFTQEWTGESHETCQSCVIFHYGAYISKSKEKKKICLKETKLVVPLRFVLHYNVFMVISTIPSPIHITAMQKIR